MIIPFVCVFKMASKHVLELLNNDSDVSDLEDDSDISEDEETGEWDPGSEHSSESELDYDSSDDEIDEAEGDILRGKNGTEWKPIPERQNSRRPRRNIVKGAPGPVGVAKGAKSPVETFNLFLSTDAVEIILKYTNQRIRGMQDDGRTRNPPECGETCKAEVLAVIGLLIIAGAQKSNRHDLKDLWSTDGLGLDIFRSVFSYNRFMFLLAQLRFDDKATRPRRLETDRLAPIRELLDLVVEKFRKMYVPTEFVTLDENLDPFRGRCRFVQYMPSKPAKYGIKTQCLCDAETFYICNMEIYAGTQPEGPFQLSNKPFDITMRLARPILTTGRNITTDNWYTSIEIAEALLAKDTTIVGTLKKNKPQIPPEMLPNKTREEKSSIFGFRKDMMIAS